MQAGYTIEHVFPDSCIGGVNNTAHIICSKKTNTVYVAYFTNGYMPQHNAENTVAIFKIKPKTK